MNTINQPNLTAYLEATYFLDFNREEVAELAQHNCKATDSNTQKAIDLYNFVRDAYCYNPYNLDLRKEAFKVSHLIQQKMGYCIEKALILAALGRAVGIPTRLGFSNVRNHLGTSFLEQYLATDVLVFHGCTEFYLEDKWLKCTPAFNIQLCQKLGVAPLEFDGKHHSIFQECDKKGGKFMEYLQDFGTFTDMPLDLFIQNLKQYYPILWEKGIPQSHGRFTPPNF